LIPIDSEGFQRREQLTASFPMFFFIDPGREVRNRDRIQKDCRPVAFPVSLSIAQNPHHPGTSYQCQLAAVISPLRLLDEDLGHHMHFLRVVGQWIRSEDTDVRAVEEPAALQENFPETEDSIQTANTLFSVADN
jgi:hypothetical protein